MCLIAFKTLVFYETICVNALFNKDKALFDSKHHNDIGICLNIIHYFSKFSSTANIASFHFSLYYVALISPVIIFLMFDNPHDCFTCLGKDPERKYSSFQLSIKERRNRRMIARYS